MFRKIALVVLVGMLTTVYSADAQELVITGPWKLSFEDKKEFSSADWNDAGWYSLSKLEWADDHKTTANRTLWIRKKVVVPSSLKAAFAKTGVLSLSMGKIMQSDDTYLNGKAIGATGSGDTYRNYLLTPTDILWDKENTIAIRVRHWGQFKVSMVPKLEAALPDYFFLYNAGIKGADAKEPVLNKDGVYELYLTNRSPNKTEGIVTADFYDFSGTKLSSAQQKVAVGTGKNTVSFPYKSSSPFVKVVYTVAIPSYQYSHQWNSEAGYQNIAYKPAPPVVAYKAPQKYFPADISKQKLEGWLGDRLKANTEKRLYKVDEPALLAGFINRPGNHSWIGEHVGKFLDAACNAYANTADPALKIQIDRTAQQLIAAQLPDGYLGTYGPDSHWTSWDVWSHRYDLIGLLHYYEISGFAPALEASKKIGDLLMQTFGVAAGQKDLIKSGPHVGMAATCILESMGELYRFSGDKRYLNYCYYIIKNYDGPRGPRILTTLDSTGGRVDKVANAKAYEMLSNFLGIIKLYRLTADEKFLKPMVAAWKDIVASRLYITGTASSFEHFQDDDILPATNGDNMGEGCVTTTWVQFNYQLLCVTGEMKYLDELERSVYNHLTGAENPQTGGVSYYTPLVGVKPFGTGITCCMSSVPRGIAMIPLFAAGKISTIPTFLFYQPGRFVTSVKNLPVSFTTTTVFPANGDVKILVDETMPAAYSLAFRKPWWSADFSIKVNGKAQAVTAGETVNINRIWKKGDVIAVHFSMPLKVLEGGKTYPGKLAFQRGPQVLAFDKKLNATDAESVSVPASTLTPQPATKALPAGWVGTESFEVKATTGNDTKLIILVPYADAGQTGGAISTWLKKKHPVENKILVIGSSNTDMVLKTTHFPRPGETILGGDFFVFQGGKGANQAVAATRAGGDVSFICRVGTDAFGEAALAHYRTEGIDVTAALKDADAPTGVAVITVNAEGENSIIVASGANAALSVADVEGTTVFDEAGWIITQLETPLPVIEYIAAEARRTNKKLVLNPAPAAALPASVYEGLYLITPNQTETALLTGVAVTDEASAREAAAIFAQKGVQNILITMGSKGAYAACQGYTGLVPSYKVTAVDTTAAGDVFNGALVVALSEGLGWEEAAQFACKAAAVSVTKMGAQASAPTRAEIMAFVNGDA